MKKRISGSKIKFVITDKEFEGAVVGVATQPNGVIGRGYIVECKELNSEDYPYDYCVVFESMILKY